MSKYTTQVRFICEMESGLNESVGYDKINDVISLSNESVIGEYPIFDELYRETLNSKILKHYYTREICEETVGLWKLRLNTRMNEIMPFYNKWYKSEALTFNPFYDFETSTTRAKNEDTNDSLVSVDENLKNQIANKNIDVEKNTENSVISNNKNDVHSGVTSASETVDNKNQTDKYADTPQGGISGLESGTYLTNARIIGGNETGEQKTNQQSDSTGSTDFKETTNFKDVNSFSENEVNNIKTNGKKTNETKIKRTEDYIEHMQGKRGSTSYSKMLVDYRDSFVNIDKMIIDELSDLFFGLW